MSRPLIWVYSCLYTLFLLLSLPFYYYRLLREGKTPSRLIRRLAPPAFPNGNPQRGPRLWIHAVSVGEVKSIQPLVKALSLPRDQMLISTVTETGRALAENLYGQEAHVFYFPLDWGWNCKRYLKTLSPAAVLMTEAELWPNFLRAAASIGIPVILINGRISDRSFPRYRRIRFFLRPLLRNLAAVCVQSAQDRARIVELGADPERVFSLGNLKYDYAPTEIPERADGVSLVHATLKPRAEDLLWICGSTRDGEEELLLQVFQSLLPDFPALHLLLAPRHLHRIPEIGRLLKERKLNHQRFSALNGSPQDSPRVLLLDTIGELAQLYQLADVVFVGGSLVRTGGHNIIEAAFFGKPILFGPHMENFSEVSAAFVRARAALQVASHQELLIRMRELLKDPEARRKLGESARRVMAENQGAVRRTLEIVGRYLHVP